MKLNEVVKVKADKGRSFDIPKTLDDIFDDPYFMVLVNEINSEVAK